MIDGRTYLGPSGIARTGSPEGEAPPAWPRATVDATTVQMIATEGTEHVEDPRTRASDLRERELPAA